MVLQLAQLTMIGGKPWCFPSEGTKPPLPQDAQEKRPLAIDAMTYSIYNQQIFTLL